MQAVPRTSHRPSTEGVAVLGNGCRPVHIAIGQPPSLASKPRRRLAAIIKSQAALPLLQPFFTAPGARANTAHTRVHLFLCIIARRKCRSLARSLLRLNESQSRDGHGSAVGQSFTNVASLRASDWLLAVKFHPYVTRAWATCHPLRLLSPILLRTGNGLLQPRTLRPALHGALVDP